MAPHDPTAPRVAPPRCITKTAPHDAASPTAPRQKMSSVTYKLKFDREIQVIGTLRRGEEAVNYPREP